MYDLPPGRHQPPNDAAESDGVGIIVNDCQADERFANCSSVSNEERELVRFYAGVPLVSRNGYKIGVLAVMDASPREGLRSEELTWMRDMGRNAISHLEWARDRVDRFKGERVVRGMATFIEEVSTLYDDPSNPNIEHRNSHSESRPGEQNSRRGSRNDSNDIFPLAADILRDATLADGCAIFGAKADSGSQRDQDPECSPLSRPCKLLSLSVAGHHVENPLGTGHELPITVGTLDKYFKAAPQGCAFSFPPDFKVTSPGGDSPCASKEREQSSHDSDIDHEELLRKLPGTSNVIFLPLRHPVDNRLIAGIFLWTIFSGQMADTDLSHVRAFANSIVAEIMRMDLQREETAKTTFMASMSHELRSPLHGILGSAEFLIETTANSYDAGLVSTIITCGKTLLDTLNHVLDHSKINKLKGLHKQDKTKNLQAVNSNMDATQDLALVDLGALVEEVVDAVTAAHTSRTLSTFSSSTASVPLGSNEHSFDSLSARRDDGKPEHTLGVAVLLDISPRDSWVVRVQQGSLQRIVMNLFGNALKYTASGFVALSLRTLESTEEGILSVLIRVVDSGKGIGRAFQQEGMFEPFTQEDPFQPGTGLGLSIVKEIVSSLDGSIEIKSTPGVGTEVDVYLKLAVDSSAASNNESSKEVDPLDANRPSQMHAHPLAMASKMAGKRLVLLDPQDPDGLRPPMHQASRFQQTIRETCEKWFGMHVSRAVEMSDEGNEADLYFYGEPPPMELLRNYKREHRQRAVPVILACQSGHDAIEVIRNQGKFLNEVGEIVEVLQEPCGPRKLAKTLMYCLNRAEEINRRDASAFEGITSPPEQLDKQIQLPTTTDESSLPYRPIPLTRQATEAKEQETARKSVSAALAMPTTPVLDPNTPKLRSQGDTSLDLLASEGTGHRPNMLPQSSPSPSPQAPSSPSPPKSPHVLIVDDNKINRNLLVMFMKKNNITYEQAENGQEAVDLYTSSSFNYILMDISMPVMDGIEATRQIRRLEYERQGQQQGQGKPVKIFALTGLASKDVREEAETAGVDLFLPKPVKFAELTELLV
ncbi:hypothetical protein PRZ48_007342 [Zasmidium cellare]|uniref:histidine kinase n=1 Tax=Zasmidium cellare TaxID=395010 RepID=A0ABR0EL65_ZASCE|nr:hypothetical protein PRZ48_007342 [Zasmidium cellare]